MKFLMIIVSFYFSLFFESGIVHAEKQRKIRIAIFDTLVWEKLATEKYAKNYIEGVKVAVEAAGSLGFEVVYRTFEYNKTPLAIIQEVQKVKAWKPHFIVGPRFSSLFLLLKKQFKNILVVSPLATANNVKNMPSNFYSMSPSNRSFVKALAEVTKNKFPGKKVHPVVELDCKYCVDFSEAYRAYAPSIQLKMSSVDSEYQSVSVESLNVKQLLLGEEEKNTIYLLPNRSYTSGILMGRIATYLRRDNIVYIGGDGWGDWSAGYTGKFKSPFQYRGIRISAWSLHKTDEETAEFHRKYQELFKKKAEGVISLISYQTVSSVMKVIVQLAGDQEATVSAKSIARAFGKVLEKKPNYGRPSSFGIYDLSQDGELFVDFIKVE